MSKKNYELFSTSVKEGLNSYHQTRKKNLVNFFKVTTQHKIDSLNNNITVWKELLEEIIDEEQDPQDL